MNNIKATIFFFALAFTVSNCGKELVLPNVEFEVAFEESANLKGEKLEFRVIEVLEDSRCPIDVYCALPGTVLLKLEFTLKNETLEKEIYLYYNDPPVIVGNHQINLSKVTPERELDKEISLEDYTFTFLINEI